MPRFLRWRCLRLAMRLQPASAIRRHWATDPSVSMVEVLVMDCILTGLSPPNGIPKAAFAAAVVTDKVRINPGNFVDPGRTFKKLEYTDEEYAAELKRIEDAFVPFLDTCRRHGTAIRIGVNHGSLSDRIMSRYGDTPAGMVESAIRHQRHICAGVAQQASDNTDVFGFPYSLGRKPYIVGSRFGYTASSSKSRLQVK